jgi:hypothetical protein
MIRFKCPSCQKVMGVDDSNAGALAMCPACKTTFRIPMAPGGSPPLPPVKAPILPPAVETVAPAPRPAPVLPPAPAYADDATTYAVELEPETRKPLPSIVHDYTRGEDDEEDEDQPRRLRWGGEGGVWTGDLIPGFSNFALIMTVLIVGWVLLGGLSALVPYAGLLMVGVGGLLCFITGVWLMKIAFEDGMGTGLGFVFIPFYGIMFIFSNLDRTGVPFVINLVGSAYWITGLVCMAIRSSS